MWSITDPCDDWIFTYIYIYKCEWFVSNHEVNMLYMDSMGEDPIKWTDQKIKIWKKTNWVKHTPLKFNMEPENQPLEKEIPNWETIIFRFHVKTLACIIAGLIELESVFFGWFFLDPVGGQKLHWMHGSGEKTQKSVSFISRRWCEQINKPTNQPTNDKNNKKNNVNRYKQLFMTYPLLLGGPPRYNHSRPFLVGLLWFPCGPTVESHIPISDLTQKRPWYPEKRSKMIIHQTTHWTVFSSIAVSRSFMAAPPLCHSTSFLKSFGTQKKEMPLSEKPVSEKAVSEKPVSEKCVMLALAFCF